MNETMPRMMKRARLTTSILCLCLTVAACLSVISRSVAGQVKQDQATPPSAELTEVKRLVRQIVELSEAHRYREAIPLAQRALSLIETAPDATPFVVADTNIRLAMLYVANGEYRLAEPLYLRGLAIREQAFGLESPLIASSLNNLAELYRMMGEYARAEPVLLRALAIWEKRFGPDDAAVATAINNLARLYYLKGDYARVEALYLRSLETHEKLLGPNHSDVAAILSNLAGLYYLKGEYARVEPLYERSLAIQEKVYGPHHTSVASSLHNLAGLYRAKGDYERAEPFYLRSLAIYEKILGPEHPDVAIVLHNLALLYADDNNYARAESLYQRVLAIEEKALGTGHPKVATSLTSLASLYADNDPARAEPLYQRAIAIYEKTLGTEHPSLAGVFNNLAHLYKAKGDYARAESLHRRALAIREKSLGADHFDVANSLVNLSALDEAKGNIEQAVQLRSRAEEVRERNISLILSTGSERQKLAYLATFSDQTNATVSLHARAAPSDPLALDLSLTTILRRKGRALDAMADQVTALRRRLDPQDKALLDQLSVAQSQLSARVLGGAGEATAQEHRETIARLEAQVEQLQDSIGRRSAEFRLRTQPVTIEQVRQSLPRGAALIEFFSYKPFDAKAKTRAERYGRPRYVAYVLHKTGQPSWADLGEAEAVEADLSRLLKALKCPESPNRYSAGKCPGIAEVKLQARTLDERVMRPVRKLLGATRQVFLSPDGVLNLLPFGTLVDEHDRYLVETLSLTYLTSGRDLLRLQPGGHSRQSPVVIADPLFGDRQAAPVLSRGDSVTRGESLESSRRSAGMGQYNFGQLNGTAQEAKTLSSILPGATVLTQAAASESALKRLTAPRVLHVATHGFFLPDQSQAEAGGGDNTRGIGLGDKPRAARGENPLLRSGLALEGANRRQSVDGNDGILTALEAAGLDLWGTQLVVLSACETGVGEVRNGEGVYGLRRALVLAGSETQVMSLWQVSDAATRDLMVGYYHRLITGEGRAEALRQIQLQMLKSGGVRIDGPQRSLLEQSKLAQADLRHPYYWAAFIQSGDWRAMTTR
jgi:CHAT domain-containing protein/tetratricopeptide (TPR) repeat protein